MYGRQVVLNCCKPSRARASTLTPPGLGVYKVAVCVNRLESRLCPSWVLIVAQGSSLGDVLLSFCVCFCVSVASSANREYIQPFLRLLTTTSGLELTSMSAAPQPHAVLPRSTSWPYHFRFLVPVLMECVILWESRPVLPLILLAQRSEFKANNPMGTRTRSIASL